MASGDASTDVIGVEVAYSPAPRTVDLVRLTVPAGSSVAQAVQRSGLAGRHTSLDLAAMAVGIWGRPATWNEALAEGDRVELCRPLRVDPKEARRQRYRAQGERGRRKPGMR